MSTQTLRPWTDLVKLQQRDLPGIPTAFDVAERECFWTSTHALTDVSHGLPSWPSWTVRMLVSDNVLVTAC
jgi:hypothetical protein